MDPSVDIFHTHTQTHTYIHIYVHIYIHANIYTYIYIHTPLIFCIGIIISIHMLLYFRL